MRNLILFVGALSLALSSCRRAGPQRVSEIQLGEETHQDRRIEGFYGTQGAWRWTSRVFAVSLDPPAGDRAVYVELDFGVPQELMEDARSVTLVGSVNGVEVGRQTQYADGRFLFTRYVPVRALTRRTATVRFELDRSMKRPDDGATLGLLAMAVRLVEYEGTAEYARTQEWLAREGFKKVFDQERVLFPPSRALELRQLFAALPALETLKFQNVPVAQNPLDLWMIQQLVQEQRPELIVETGTGAGGSALYLASVLHAADLQASKVLTVAPRAPDAAAVANPLWSKYVEFRQDDPTAPAVVAELSRRAAGRAVLVLLNSDRAGSRMLEQMNLYAPLVSRRGYLVVQHTAPGGLPPPSNDSPAEAVRRFLEAGGAQNFEPDPSREMMIFTANSGGWLRRK